MKNKRIKLSKKFLLIGLAIVFVMAMALSGSSKKAKSGACTCFCPYLKSTQYGGDGGGPFSDDLTQVKRITKVSVRHGRYIDAINITYQLTSDATIEVKHGGEGGNLSSFLLAEGEYINRIEGMCGIYVDQITFFTNTGQKYGPYGGGGGGPFAIGDICVGGFFGRCGEYIDAIGAFIAVK